MRYFFLYIFLLFLPAWAEDPWSVDAEHPVLLLPKSTSSSQSPSILGLYQRYISSFDGSRCPMYPTCSAYAAISFRDYGVLMGFVLTVDRLVHESGKISFFNRRRHGSLFRYEDFPHDNYHW